MGRGVFYCAHPRLHCLHPRPDSTMDESITVMASSNDDTHASGPERIGMDIEEHTPSQNLGSQDNETLPCKKPRRAAPFPKIAQPQQNGLHTGFEEDPQSEKSAKEDDHSKAESKEETNAVSPPSYVLHEPIITG